MLWSILISRVVGEKWCISECSLKLLDFSCFFVLRSQGTGSFHLQSSSCGPLNLSTNVLQGVSSIVFSSWIFPILHNCEVQWDPVQLRLAKSPWNAEGLLEVTCDCFTLQDHVNFQAHLKPGCNPSLGTVGQCMRCSILWWYLKARIVGCASQVPQLMV